jgi:GTP-binding protein HflX
VVAYFLIHVLDVTSLHWEKHRTTTLEVLAELGAGERPTLTVFNKTDAATAAQLRAARQLIPEALFISAKTGAGLEALGESFLEIMAGSLDTTELLVPHDRYDVIARLHALGHIYSQEHEEGGAHILGRFPATQAGYFAPFVVKR